MKWKFQNLSPTILALVAIFTITSCGEEEEIIEEPLNVIWTMPPNGYDGRPETIKIQFNRVIEPSTISGAIIVSPSLGEIDQERSYWSDGYTYRVAFAKNPEPGTKYTIIVGKSVKDVYGNSLPHPYTFSFTYRFGVEYTEPESGEEDVSCDDEISIEFSHPIDIEAGQSAFSISPAVEGRFSPRYLQRKLDIDYLDFVPLEPLTPSTEYTVTINKSAKASNGQPLVEPYIFTFTTEGFRVEDTDPEDGERNIDLSIWRIYITFNCPIDVEACKKAFSISPPVKGDLHSESSEELRFNPSEPLTPSTEYTVTIGTSAKASSGEPLAEPYIFSFTTEK